MGIKISTIPVYTAEVSPASIRGGMVTSFQLWVAFGIMIGFCSNLIFMNIGRLAWRFQLAAAFAPAIPLQFSFSQRRATNQTAGLRDGS